MRLCLVFSVGGGGKRPLLLGTALGRIDAAARRSLRGRCRLAPRRRRRDGRLHRQRRRRCALALVGGTPRGLGGNALLARCGTMLALGVVERGLAHLDLRQRAPAHVARLLEAAGYGEAPSAFPLTGGMTRLDG